MSTIDTNFHSYSITLNFSNKTVVLPNDCIKEFYFIEDIFSFSFTGKLTIMDKINLVNDNLLTGTETITLNYGIESDSVRNFYIYKISSIEQANNGSQQGVSIIELFVVDISFLIFTQKQISYSWLETTGDDIIKDMLKKHCHIGDKNIGQWETSGEQMQNYFSPFWTVSQNISYLLPRMSGGSSGNNSKKRSGYLFYSSTEGLSDIKFNLVPLQTLLKQTKSNILKVNNDDDGIYFLFKSSTIDVDKLNKILSWKVSGMDRTSFNILGGGKAIDFDQRTKKAIERKYTYKEMIENTMILGNYSLFPDISDDTSYIKLLNDGSDSLVDNLFYDEWVKKYCLQNQITITVQGHEKRCCGKMIYIPWVIENEEKISIENTKWSGGFLIKSVIHYFKPSLPSYFQKLVLIKNGYQNLTSDDSNAVLAQTNAQFKNSFDSSSYEFKEDEWKIRDDTLFNRKEDTSPDGLLPRNPNIVDTVLDTVKGWFK